MQTESQNIYDQSIFKWDMFVVKVSGVNDNKQATFTPMELFTVKFNRSR